jgi:NAD-dependent deacetylase
VLTGAGVSAESGIPTFREAQSGLWARYNPEDLATPRAFQRNPQLVWEWYGWRRQMVLQAEPNPAHLALAELERSVPHFTLITQNVDNLHQRAGSRNVLQLHGSIVRARCTARETLFETWEETAEIPPRCPECGAYLRPDVVWFGEPLPEPVLTQAWEEAGRCNLLLVVGTSALVHPAASLPLAALRAGATVVEINPDTTPLSSMVHYVLRGPAGQILPSLVQKSFPNPKTVA